MRKPCQGSALALPLRSLTLPRCSCNDCIYCWIFEGFLLFKVPFHCLISEFSLQRDMARALSSLSGPGLCQAPSPGCGLGLGPVPTMQILP